MSEVQWLRRRSGRCIRVLFFEPSWQMDCGEALRVCPGGYRGRYWYMSCEMGLVVSLYRSY